MMGDIGALKVSGSRSIKIAPGAVVCVESEIRGDVTIGARTVVHPKARIIAEAGPIIIGESNLIEEQVLIINRRLIGISRRWGWVRRLPGGWPDGGLWRTGGKWMQRCAALAHALKPELFMRLHIPERSIMGTVRYPQKNGHVDPNRDEPITMIIGSNNVFEVDCQSEALKIDDNNIIESKARVGRDMILSSGCVVGACCDVKTCEVLPENTVIYGNNCLRRLQSEKPQPQTLQLDFLMKILPNYHHLKRSPKPQTPPAKS
uniref:Dynactin subunit 6 n=1 Tax=Eptatretus burgeri TaxID=7764 RepID=A0A8C4NDS4_EPTBU